MITHTQRVKAALEGKMLDRPAFAAWGPHMNLVDRNAKDFARATIDYQNAHHFDFIKVMPNGMYFPEAFGQKLKDADFILDETWQNVQVNAINDPHECAQHEGRRLCARDRSSQAHRGLFPGRRPRSAHRIQPVYLDG